MINVGLVDVYRVNLMLDTISINLFNFKSTLSEINIKK